MQGCTRICLPPLRGNDGKLLHLKSHGKSIDLILTFVLTIVDSRYDGASGSNGFEVSAAYVLQEWQGPQFPKTGRLLSRFLCGNLLIFSIHLCKKSELYWSCRVKC